MHRAICPAIGLIAVIAIIYFFRAEAFRSEAKKTAIAETLARGGEPAYGMLKNMGLDGAEAWSVRQLWHKGQWSQGRIAGML